MTKRILPGLPVPLLQEIANTYGTPVFVYDEAGIRQTAQSVTKAFGWAKGYRNYFAVKATPTPAILRVLSDEGMGFDCSSRAELRLVQQHVPNADIFFTSNNTPDEDYRLAYELGAVINIDKLSEVERALNLFDTPPARMSVRYNPGREATGNHILGDPLVSKFGDTKEHVLEAVALMHTRGVPQIGLHAMIASNENNPASFRQTAALLKALLQDVAEQTDAKISFINIGGGLGINYDHQQPLPDVSQVSSAIQQELGGLDIPVVSEFGRYITGPHGILLSRITHGYVESHKRYLHVDTSVNNLPGYASDTTNLHHIEILGKEQDERQTATVVGSICTDSDRMFKERDLPKSARPGDLLAVYDTGAHGRAKAHNYNLRPRAGEVLVHPNHTHTLIRRHETEDDLFATVKGL